MNFVLLLVTAALGEADAPTFHEDVEPLFQRHCQSCHRDGGAAPFALEDFDDAKGWSPQIAEVVSSRRMPPWDADRTIGKFANDRSLDEATIDAIVRWAKGGAKEGDPARAPQKKTWPSGWSLSEPPDLVLTTPVVRVPAEGTLPYEYVRLATNLAEDRWVRAAEIRSESPQVVHHVLVFADGPRRPVAPVSGDLPVATGPDAAPRPWRPAFNQLELLQGAPPNERAKWAGRFRKLIAHDLRFGEAGGLNGYFISGLAGGTAVQFDPGEGKFLPAGAELTFQIHHQPNGKPADSTTTIALWFCKEPPPRTLDTRGVATVVFEIPPDASAHEVVAEYRFPAAATLRSLQPHMHVRGKDFTYVARLPKRPNDNGGGGGGAEEKVLLRVPSFDFNWQEEYVLAEPLRLPAGTVLRAVAHYDNTAANPLNPDPSQSVFFGLQTYEEMMIGYFEVAWDPSELDEGD